MLNAYHRKDRRTWTYRFTFPTKDGAVYTKGGFRTRKDALEAGRRHLNALELGVQPKKGERIPTGRDLWDLYDKDCGERNQTREWRYSKEKTFCRHFPSVLILPAVAITAAMLQRCVNEATGIELYMRGELVKIAKAFFAWAHRAGHLPTDPSQVLEKPQGHKHHPNSWRWRSFPPEEDIEAVMAIASPDERDQILIGRHTGSEPASLARLCWREVHFDRREVEISRKKNRSASLKYHTVPLSGAAFACLERRFGVGREPTEHVFPATLTDMRWKVMLRKASAAVGREIAFGRAVFKHMFRTAVANEKDLSPPQIEAITGCSWETLTRHYIKADTRPAHQVVSRIFSSHPSSVLPDFTEPITPRTPRTDGCGKVREGAPRYICHMRRAA